MPVAHSVAPVPVSQSRARALEDDRALWDLEQVRQTRALLCRDERPDRVAASADGSILALMGRRFVSVIDRPTGALLDEVETPPGWHQGMVLRPDGRALLVFREDGAVFERPIAALDQALLDEAREAARHLAPAAGEGD